MQKATIDDFKQYLDQFYVVDGDRSSTDELWLVPDEFLDMLIGEEQIDAATVKMVPKIVADEAEIHGIDLYDTAHEVVEDYAELFRDGIEAGVEQIAQKQYLMTHFAEVDFFHSDLYDPFVTTEAHLIRKNITDEELVSLGDVIQSSDLSDFIAEKFGEQINEDFNEGGWFDEFFDEALKDNMDYVIEEDTACLRALAKTHKLVFLPTSETIDDNFDYSQPEVVADFCAAAQNDAVGDDEILDYFENIQID